MYLMEEIFKEYDETAGVGDLLFVNKHNLSHYRFYRRRNDWDECYMVEFNSDSNNYKLYWGHNESDRGIIDVTPILPPFESQSDWKRVGFRPLLAYNFPNIIEDVQEDIIKRYFDNKKLSNYV